MLSKIKWALAVIAVLLTAISTPVQAQSKVVFAHYLVANQSYGNGYNFDYVAGYMKEIQQAQAIGIDGFALDVGGWSGQPAYIQWCTEIFQAAVNLHSGFKLYMNADMCCTNSAADVVDMVRRFVNNPVYSPYYFRYEGRPFLSTFVGQDEGGGGAGALNFWKNDVLAPLENGTNAANGIPATPINVYFVPLFTPDPSVNNELPTYNEVLSATTSSFDAWWNQVADGLFYWGIAGVPGSGGTLAAPNLDQLLSAQSYATIAHSNGLTFLSPVDGCQFWGADGQPGRRYYEYSGGEGLRKQWANMFANTMPDWVEIVTWNDFVECGYICPIDDPNLHPGNNLYTTAVNYYRQHVGAYNLMPYYIQTYKNGSAPAITTDAIYWWYRTSSKNLVASGDIPVTNQYGPVADNIYVTCNLTAAATLKVTSGGNVTNVSVPAGSNDVEIPFSAGPQYFELDRNGAVVIPSHVADPVLSSITLYNFDYSSGYMDANGNGGGNGFSQPWFGTPQSIPGMVYNYTYDTGGQGVAYNDPSTSNQTQCYFARPMEAVDTEPCSDNPPGADVAYPAPGMWLNYSVNVTASGAYTCSFRVASASAGGSIHMEDENGNNLTGSVKIPVTGSSQNWATVSAPITLTAGRHWLKIVDDVASGTDAFGLYYFTIMNGSATLPAAPTGLTGLGTDGQSSINWNPVPGATAYAVYRGSSPGGEGASPLMVSINGTVWDDTGLADGTTYYYKVQATNSAGAGPLSAEVAVTPVLVPAVTAPGVPTNLAATAGNAQVALTWTPGSSASSYNVYRGTSAGGESATPIATGVSASAYTDTAVANTTTYYYKVASVNSIGTSAQSNEASATPSPPQAPAAPTNLTATGGNAQVALSWNTSTGATSYNVYRGTSSGGEGATAIATGIGAGSYTDTTVANGTTYYYKVAAVNTGGTSGLSNEASATPALPPAPPAPTNLAAIGSDASVSLTWSASTGATSYSVYRGTSSGGEGATAVKTGLASPSYTDTGLAGGTTYYYKVAAVNSAGTSAQSTEASAKTLSAVYQIDCGSGSAVSPYVADEFFSAGNEFSSSATINTSGVTNPAPAAVYQTVRWLASFNYTIPNLTAGSSYLVRLHFCELSFAAAGSREFNVAINGTSVLSNFDIFATAGGENVAVERDFTATANSSGQIVIAFSQGAADNPEIAGIEVYGGAGQSQNPPPAPTNLAATAGNAQVSLTWTGSTGATSYNVYRGTSSGGESSTAIGSATGTSYTDTTAVNGTTYYYTVKAVNAAGTSGASNEASANPEPAIPAAPTNLAATAGNAQVSLTWTGSTGATSYNVYRGTSSGGESSTALGTSTSTSYTDTTATNGTKYYYTVKAVNTSGTSSASNETSATPEPGIPSAPTNLAATAGNAQAGLTWTASTGATSYNVYRGTTSGGEGSTAIGTSTGTSYTDTTAANGTTYYYTVKAVNGGGTSGASNEASATPEPSVPPAPTGLTATAGNATVSLTWSSSTGATSYNIYRGTTSGGEGSTAIGTSTGTSYTDTTAANGTTYYYTVKAVGGGGTSGASNEAHATPSGGTTAVYQIDCGSGSAVSPFAADEFFSGGTEFSSTATINTSGVTNPAPAAVYQTVRWGAMTYTIPNLTAGQSYTVRLHFCELTWTAAGQRLFNVAINGTSYLSNFDVFATAGGQDKALVEQTTATANSSGQIVISFTVGSADNPEIAGIEIDGSGGSGGTAPPAPTGLTATSGNATVSLTWSSSSGATSYSVYRGTSSGGEGSTAIGTSTGTSYTDSSVTNGTTYFYKVAAVNSAGTSGISNEASATPQPSIPPAPTGLTATAGNAQASLTWTGSSGATSYNVYRGTSAGGESSTAIVTGLTGTSYTNTGLTNGTTYYYKVAAVNSAGTSGMSNEASATPTAGLTAVYQIDCGSSSAVSPFVADEFFSAGNEFSSTATINTSGVTNAAPAAVYQTVRWNSSFNYTIPNLTAGASYTVRLHFCELTWTAAGQRVFNVAINGNSYLSSFDIFKTAGAENKALVEQTTATANSSGQIVISFTQGSADNPEIAGIEVLH